MTNLTQAMGLNPSSIYAAFGDKHALFSTRGEALSGDPGAIRNEGAGGTDSRKGDSCAL